MGKKYTYTPLKPPFSPAKLQLISLSTPENSQCSCQKSDWNETAKSIPLLYRVGIYSIFWSFVLGPRFKWLKTLRLPLLSKKLLHTFHHCNLIFLWHGNIFLPQSHPVLTLHIINSSTVCCLSSSLRIITHASQSIYIICQLLSSCHQFKRSPVFLIIS